jgi:hypothetical protein
LGFEGEEVSINAEDYTSDFKVALGACYMKINIQTQEEYLVVSHYRKNELLIGTFMQEEVPILIRDRKVLAIPLGTGGRKTGTGNLKTGTGNLKTGTGNFGNPTGKEILAIPLGTRGTKNAAHKKCSAAQAVTIIIVGQKRTHSSKQWVIMLHTDQVNYTPVPVRPGKQVSTFKKNQPSQSPQSDESDDGSSTDDDESAEEISQVSSNDDRQPHYHSLLTDQSFPAAGTHRIGKEARKIGCQ